MEHRPRVLIVAASMRTVGGQAVMAARLVQDLRRDGFSVGFQPVDCVPPFLRAIDRIKYLRTLVNSALYIASLALRVWRYDVVHVFSASYWSFLITPAPAITLGKLFRRRVIINYHSGEAEDHLRRSGRFTRWLLRLPDAIVVPSQFLADVFHRFGFETRVIANNVDLSAFTFRPRADLRPNILVPRALEPLYNVSLRTSRI